MSNQPSLEITFEEFKKIDARVGTITTVERVPRTAKLYRILVDLGSLGVRQTISSLVGYYEPNELVGKRIVFLCNLKPTKFAGEVSQGMLLAGRRPEVGVTLNGPRDSERCKNHLSHTKSLNCKLCSSFKWNDALNYSKFSIPR